MQDPPSPRQQPKSSQRLKVHLVSGEHRVIEQSPAPVPLDRGDHGDLPVDASMPPVRPPRSITGPLGNALIPPSALTGEPVDGTAAQLSQGTADNGLPASPSLPEWLQPVATQLSQETPDKSLPAPSSLPEWLQHTSGASYPLPESNASLSLLNSHTAQPLSTSSPSLPLLKGKSGLIKDPFEFLTSSEETTTGPVLVPPYQVQQGPLPEQLPQSPGSTSSLQPEGQIASPKKQFKGKPLAAIPKEELPTQRVQVEPLLQRLQEGTPTRLQVSLKQNEGQGSQKLHWDLTGTAIAEDPEFTKHTTIPMMVLTSIAKQQKRPTPTMKTEISGAASNATISGIGNVAGYVLKSGSTFLMQHGLGAAAFGLYSLSFSVVSLIASIFTFGLDDAMVRYIAIYRSKQQGGLVRNLTIFCTALAGIMGLLGGIAVLYFAPFLADRLTHHPETAPLLQLMAPIIPLTSMQMIWMAGLQGFKDFKKRVLTQRIGIPLVVVVLLLITIIFFPHNVTAVVIVTLISTVLSTVFCLYFLIGRVAEMKVTSSTYEVREWLGFSTPNFLTNVVDIVLDAIDTLLLGYFGISKVSIGQYNAAIKISGFIAMPLTSLNAMFSPTIAELHSQNEKQKLEAMFKVVTQWAITFSMPIFCISAVFSVSLLEVLSGRDFVGAWPLLIAFGLGGMANAGTGSVGLMLLMTGNQKLSFINSLTAIVINLVLGIILTPRFGAMGTAISTGLATAVVNIMRLVQVRLILKMQPYRKATLKPLAAGLISSAISGGLLYLLYRTGWSVHVANIHVPIELSLIPVFLASYTGTLMLFGATPEDKIVLDRLRKKLKRGGNNKKK